MVKRRKTLKQKKQSDVRITTPHRTSAPPTSSTDGEILSQTRYQYSFESKAQTKPLSVTKAVHPNEYAILSMDLRKTTIVTGIIIALEIALYYAMSFTR